MNEFDSKHPHEPAEAPIRDVEGHDRLRPLLVAERAYVRKLYSDKEAALAEVERLRDVIADGARGIYLAGQGRPTFDDAQVYAVARQLDAALAGENRQTESKSVNVRPDMNLIHKLTDQLIAQLRKAGREPESFTLTHDEIDGWRNQFDGEPIPVSMLCFRGIPILEHNDTTNAKGMT